MSIELEMLLYSRIEVKKRFGYYKNSPYICIMERLKEKKCTQCGIVKSREEFPRKYGKRHLDKLNRIKSRCKACDYLRTKAINEKKYKTTRKKGVNKNKELLKWFFDYKESLSCTHCSMPFKDKSCCCDFHHVDPTTKEYAISELIRHYYDKELILKELAKCIPLCANCHRILHYKK